MKNRTPELFDHIEAYLDGSLNTKDKVEFEQRLSEDQELRTEVEKHRLLQEAVGDSQQISFREKIVAVEEEYEEGVPNNASVTSWFNWKIAASILVLVGFGLLYWFQPYSAENSLFDSYFTPYPAEDVVRGEQQSPLEVAMSLYSNKNFDKAIPELKKLLHLKPAKKQLHLYLGNAYLATDQVGLAIKEFQKLMPEFPLTEQASWYLALSYLKQGEIEKVKSKLLQIVAYDGIYKSDAQQLLNEL